MRTIAMIEVTPMGTLYVDVLADPPALDIRRMGGGLVRIEVGELSRLTAALFDAGADLAVGEERFIEIANSNGTLFVDSTLWDPPGFVVWRTSGGLVRIDAGELQGLTDALILARGDLDALAVEGGSDEQMPDLPQV